MLLHSREQKGLRGQAQEPMSVPHLKHPADAVRVAGLVGTWGLKE